MRPHYPILDGLRGTAAILVVCYHLLEIYYPIPAMHPIHHGYLAVDFFYLLSGFVVGYAYDGRWQKMTAWEFFKIRLVRLHPMVILGVLIGAIGFYFDPYTNGMQYTSLLKLIGVMLISFTLLPSPDIRGWGGLTHCLDAPCWSLLQEYIANIIYALFAKKMSKTSLWIMVVISACALIALALWNTNLAIGYKYKTVWAAPVRMMFPFFAGLLLFRTGRLIRIPVAYIICPAALIALFILPTFKYNGLYEAVCVTIGFPLIVSAGAGGTISGVWAKISKFAGDISYPIYIMHYPFIYIYTMWVLTKKPTHHQIVPVAGGLFLFFILLAWVSLKLYDEPVRKWLKAKLLVKA